MQKVTSKFRVFVLCDVKMLITVFVTCLLCACANSQSNKDLYNGQFNNEYYGGQPGNVNQNRLPNPGDTDYRTYVHNNRRYGVDPTRYNPYNPNINQPGGFPYKPLYTNPLDDQYKYVNVSFILHLD